MKRYPNCNVYTAFMASGVQEVQLNMKRITTIPARIQKLSMLYNWKGSVNGLLRSPHRNKEKRNLSRTSEIQLLFFKVFGPIMFLCDAN